ncbi:MAG: hypothetical protein COA79_03100 [Planctomycetota bacterium]|nr:MAG: hypothetical protein COA79_03100 [Planctomycetota bacterium]
MNIANENNWQQFIREGIEPKINGKIVESWKKSQAAKINPYLENLSSLPKISYKKQPASKQFFNEVVNYINTCFAGAMEDDSAWIFCDEDGFILKVRANSDYFKKEIQDMGIVERISMAENSIGTNPISFAMNKQIASTCSEAEHFLKIFHNYKGAASPIYNIEGSLRGYCMIFSKKHFMRVSTLKNQLLLLIQGVDRLFRLTRSRKRHDNLKTKVENALFEDHLVPTVILSSNGFIRQVNSPAMQMLEIDDESRNESSLDQIAKFTPTIKETSHNGLETQNIPMTIEYKKGKKVNVLVNRLPFYNSKGQFIGVSLQFYEKEKIQTKPQSTYKARYTFNDIVGITKGIQEAKDIALRVAQTNINVLLIGPSGTGKEMFAQSIHNSSDRSTGPFVSINCAAIPKDIAESELFGHAKGAFTGANDNGSIGKLEAANGGTIFLDEIGDMPLELQAKLLRVLEERKITRVGENTERPLYVRVIAATNKDLLELTQKNEFREDLYYRLSVTSIILPHLKDSKEDIPMLVENFIELYNEQMGKKVIGFQDEILERLKSYDWPGNIRELRNAIEFATMLNQGEDYITWEHMPGNLRLPLLYQKKLMEKDSIDPLDVERQEINRTETALVKKAIDLSQGKMNDAAKILGISRATMYRKIKKLGIAPYN